MSTQHREPLAANPYQARADYIELEGAPYAIAQATLALAYEQRTANLIALAQLHRGTPKGTLPADVIPQIHERLGLK